MKKSDVGFVRFVVTIILVVAMFSLFSLVAFAEEEKSEERNYCGAMAIAGFGAEEYNDSGNDNEGKLVLVPEEYDPDDIVRINPWIDIEKQSQNTLRKVDVDEDDIVRMYSEEDSWDGPVLNSVIGTVEGPSGKETYYNLPMDGVIDIMREEGFSEDEYPYWVRDDGCKMLGDYIMVAADLSIRPRGSLVDTSLGKAIVCDTGEFIYTDPYQLDIAVTW